MFLITGSSEEHLLKDKMKKLKFSPPDYALIFVIFEIVLYFIFPIIKFLYFPFTLFGILFIILGAILNYKAYKYFKHSKIKMSFDEVPPKLITFEIFRLSRNPIYLGILFILLGEAVLFGVLSAFSIPIIFFILINNITIPIEEKNLEKRFGKKYINYKEKVRRWI